MIKRLIASLLLFTFVAPLLATGMAQTVIENPALRPPAEPQEKTDSQPPKTQETPKPENEAKPEATADQSPKRIGSEFLLPASTKAWLSIPDAEELERRFDETQFGMLLKKEELKPFAEHIQSQLKQWVDDQNVRLNLNVDDLEGVHSGEICFAGVLPEDNAGEPIPGGHGLVFLMDVTETAEKARELQVKINAELVNRGAEQVEATINGIAYTKSTIDKPEVFRKKRYNFQAIVGNWMVVSNNELVFRTMLQNLSAPEKLQAFQTLGGQDAFKVVREKTALEDHDSQIRWFVDPFGYVQLAQQIRDDEALSKVARDDWVNDLKANGFDALKGMGGNVAVNTSEHEILHRTFTHANRGTNESALFDLFDFQVNADLPMTLPYWVQDDASSVVVGNWNTNRALDGAGHFYDAVIGEAEGDFERMLNDLKQDPNLQLDIRKLVSLLSDRFVVSSTIEEPITKTSERVVGGVKIKGEPDWILQSIERANPQARMIKLGNADVVEIDSTIEPEEDLSIPDIEGFGDEFADEEEQEEEEPRFQLFEKRYFTIATNPQSGEMYLLVANDKNYLRSVIESKPTQLHLADDYQQVEQALAKLTTLSKANWKTFGRMDKSLKTNYELLRRGEINDAQTILARILNQIAAQERAEQARLEGKAVDPDATREQRLDGGKLPANYAKDIAPYLGPSGSVMVTMDEGWQITGCVLRKKELVAMVRDVKDVKNKDKKPEQR